MHFPLENDFFPWSSCWVTPTWIELVIFKKTTMDFKLPQSPKHLVFFLKKIITWVEGEMERNALGKICVSVVHLISFFYKDGQPVMSACIYNSLCLLCLLPTATSKGGKSHFISITLQWWLAVPTGAPLHQVLLAQGHEKRKRVVREETDGLSPSHNTRTRGHPMKLWWEI